MADMFDSGRYAFSAWSKAGSRAFWERWLGPFDPSMTAVEANDKLHEDRITKEAQAAFMRGWVSAQHEYEKNDCT